MSSPAPSLAGLRYERLFDYFADTERYGTQDAWQVLVGDFVTTEDGTGIVHLAPAYGEVDQGACDAAGIPTLLSVDDGGRFTAVVPDFEGQQVFDANMPIIRRLREDGRLLRQASYVHSYPHCWRCRNPLIYKAVSSWFVRVSRFRDRMIEPEPADRVDPGAHPRRPVRQVARGRPRLVGVPQPVLGHADPGVGLRRPGAPACRRLRLVRRAWRPTSGGCRATRPVSRTCTGRSSTSLTRPNPDDPTGQSTMRRIPDVLDVWFDSGSMPYAQVHYPFENADWFEHHFPGDFIVEYVGQTRGWFYLLHVLATALFDRPAFTSVICHGIVLGDDGRKASKSLRNFPDPMEMFDTYGSDAVRWSLMSLAGAARRKPGGGGGEHPRGGAPGGAAAVEHLLLLHPVRGCGRRGARLPRHGGGRRAGRRAARDGPVPAGAHRRAWSPRSPRRSTPTRSPRPARWCASTSTC